MLLGLKQCFGWPTALPSTTSPSTTLPIHSANTALIDNNNSQLHELTLESAFIAPRVDAERSCELRQATPSSTQLNQLVPVRSELVQDRASAIPDSHQSAAGQAMGVQRSLVNLQNDCRSLKQEQQVLVTQCRIERSAIARLQNERVQQANQLQQLQVDYATKVEVHTQVSVAISQLGAQEAALTLQLEQVETQLINAKLAIEAQVRMFHEAESHVAQTQSQLDTAKSDLVSTVQQLTNGRNELNHLKTQHVNAQAELAQTQAQVDTTLEQTQLCRATFAGLTGVEREINSDDAYVLAFTSAHRTQSRLCVKGEDLLVTPNVLSAMIAHAPRNENGEVIVKSFGQDLVEHLLDFNRGLVPKQLALAKRAAQQLSCETLKVYCDKVQMFYSGISKISQVNLRVNKLLTRQSSSSQMHGLSESLHITKQTKRQLFDTVIGFCTNDSNVAWLELQNDVLPGQALAQTQVLEASRALFNQIISFDSKKQVDLASQFEIITGRIADKGELDSSQYEALVQLSANFSIWRALKPVNLDEQFDALQVIKLARAIDDQVTKVLGDSRVFLARQGIHRDRQPHAYSLVASLHHRDELLVENYFHKFATGITIDSKALEQSLKAVLESKPFAVRPLPFSEAVLTY